MHNQKLKGNSLLLLAAFVWGLSFISQSKGVETLSPIAFNGYRSILGAAVLLPVIYLIDSGKRKKGTEVQSVNKTLIIGGIICGALLCVASTLQTSGMVYTSPGKAAFITVLYMVIVPIIGLFTGKRPTLAIGFSVVVATIGLYLMCIDTESLALNRGDVLIFACAFVFALHILAIDHFSPKVDGVKLACLQFFVCGVLNVLLLFFTGFPSWSDTLSCWASIGYSGALSCGVGYTLQIVGQKYTDPTSASILMSLESVFATLATVILIALGWNLTGGAMTTREILGCVLMFVAILLVQLPDKKTSK